MGDISMKTTSRVPVFGQPAETYGWESPRVARAIGKHLGVDVVDTVKAVADSSGGSGGTLAQQGVEAQVYELFVRKFPLYDLLEKTESNGLVHAFDQQTAYSGSNGDTPLTVTESGAVSDDKNTYAQGTTNIAIFAARRGASLKSQFGANQSVGPIRDLGARELDGGLMKIAHDVQAEMLRFQNADNSQTTATAVKGKYDANGLNGFRYMFGASVSPAGNTVSVDITSGYTPANQTILEALGSAADALTDLGFNADMILASTAGRRYLINEQTPLRRWVDKAEVRPGISLNTVDLGDGVVPIYQLPGDAIGTISNTGTFLDIYVADSNYLSIPWLGGPTPTVLDIPVGADSKLIKYTIPFLMVGLAFHAAGAIARVQLKIA